MSEQLLNLLKLCLLALLYLFFLRVLRAVWVEVRASGGTVMAAQPNGTRRSRRESPAATTTSRLVVVEPPAARGREYPLSDELTIGRAPGCAVTIDDSYVSQLHARVFVVDGQFLVEDLGSTNGTYLNQQKVGPPVVMRPGDRLQVGSTVLELR